MYPNRGGHNQQTLWLTLLNFSLLQEPLCQSYQLKDRRVHLCLKFAKKCLVNEKTENIFPLTKKQHNMETRKEEKFKVNFAKTERYRKSSIPYMQRLMNEFAKK